MSSRRVVQGVVQLPPGIQQRGERRYRGRYRGRDGKVHATPTYATIRDAVAALNAAKADVHRGDWVAPAGLTLEAWWDQWSVTRDVAPRTATADEGRWRRNIRPYLGARRLDDLEQPDVRAWLGRLAQDGASDATRAKALTLLKTMLGKHGAVGARLRRSNPCEGVVVKAADRAADEVHADVWRILTRDETKVLLEGTPERWMPLVLLGLYAGLRWSEAATLRQADYDGTVLRVWRANTKTGRSRTIPVHPALKAVLDPLRTGGDGLLLTHRGRPLRHSTFHAHWQALVTATVGGTLRFHDLRHTCASRLLNDAGASVAEVRDIMGHASILTTQLYLHSTHAGKAAAISRL